MNHKTEPTKLNTLYADLRLAELFETMDQLHSAVSEGELETYTTLSKQDLVGLLKDVIYTAQETLSELDDAAGGRNAVVLRLMDKAFADLGQRQA